MSHATQDYHCSPAQHNALQPRPPPMHSPYLPQQAPSHPAQQQPRLPPQQDPRHPLQPLSQLSGQMIKTAYHPYSQQQQPPSIHPPPQAFPPPQQPPSTVVAGQHPPPVQSAANVKETLSGTETTGTPQGTLALPPLQHTITRPLESWSLPPRSDTSVQALGSAFGTSFDHQRLNAANQITRNATKTIHQADPSRMSVGASTMTTSSDESESVASYEDGEPSEQPKESPAEKMERIRKTMASSQSNDVYTVIEETDCGYDIRGADVLSVHRTFDGAFESVYLAVIKNSWLERSSTRRSVTARADLASDEFEDREKLKRNMIRRASFGSDSVTFHFDETTSGTEGEATYSIRRQSLQA